MSKQIEKLTDDSIMPFGQYSGYKMANVPGMYLKWIYLNNKCTPSVKAYIEENMYAIKLETNKHNNE